VEPPPSPTDFGEPLYETFYGLREQPFALSTDPRFLFLSASHRRAYEELLTGLRRREGVLLLTGETGTGKTTLCRAVIDALGQRTFSALILNPYMSDIEVLRVILRDFGLVSREEIRRGAFARADVPQLLDTLEGFLRSLLPLNSYAVVVIDEAQSLAPKVLDQIRMLGAYEQDGHRLLQLMLVGQPALGATLRTEPMRALNERITRRAALTPLPINEVDEYIRHRLSVAGGRDTVSFSPDAVGLIAELSRGLPRRINVLCDRSLEEGRVDGTSEIGPAIVKRAARSIAGAPELAPEAPADRPPDRAIEQVLEKPAERPIDVSISRPAAVAESQNDFVRPAPPAQTETDRPELDLDSLKFDSDPLEPAVAEIPLTLGVPAPESTRRGVWVWLFVGMLLMGGAGAAGYYAWTLITTGFQLPSLPAEPKFDLAPALQMRPVPVEPAALEGSPSPEPAPTSAPAPGATPPTAPAPATPDPTGRGRGGGA
jgi:type II secretory pathway predicted ATPase ExeA